MTTSTNGKSEMTVQSAERPGRQVLRQTDVPSYSIEDALRVPRAIADNYASRPTPPLRVAQAMNMQPNSSRFRMVCGAAMAYGVTEGGSNASEITITPLGKRILQPLKEDDDLRARGEALLKPRVVGEFLRKYHGAAMPRRDIAHNVLREMGVPQERVDDVLDSIIAGAESVGYVTMIKDKRYVDISEGSEPSPTAIEFDQFSEEVEEVKVDRSTGGRESAEGLVERQRPTADLIAKKRRVFLSHGENKSLIDPIKKLLSFGELKPVVAADRQSVSQPVPDKVMNDMRDCGAAIIHVDAEQRLIDSEATEHVVLNPNVLIEIGAAMALYGRRFILLVREGVRLPSNLQGLYEVRYSTDGLDGDATIRLLEAINDIKNHPLPPE